MTSNDTKKIAIYPGSFDPITNGHIDIIKRASTIFDEIIVGVLHNPDKVSLFTPNKRIEMIQKIFQDNPKIVVDQFQGLLVDFASHHGVFTIIRGLRAVSDFEFEFQMSLTNRTLNEKLDTVFFMTDVKYSYLSSSIIKQIGKFGGNIDSFVTDNVKNELIKINHE